MKRLSRFVLLACVLLAFVIPAIAATPLLPQAITEWMPTASKSVCVTMPAGRTKSVQVPTTDTRLLKWNAFKSTDGTAVTVARFLNATSSTGAYQVVTHEDVAGVASTTTRYSFKSYSSNGYEICVDKK
jgi:hypothetical protein